MTHCGCPCGLTNIGCEPRSLIPLVDLEQSENAARQVGAARVPYLPLTLDQYEQCGRSANDVSEEYPSSTHRIHNVPRMRGGHPASRRKPPVPPS